MKRIDREAFEWAGRAWPETFAKSLPVEESFHQIDRHLSARIKIDPYGHFMFVNRLLGWADWAHAGYPTIEVSESTASALMTVDNAQETSPHINVPWHSFHVKLPRTLLTVDQVCFDRIWIGAGMLNEIQSGVWLRILDSEAGDEQCRGALDLGALLLGEEHRTEYRQAQNDTYDKRRGRCLELAARLVIGALYTLEYADNFRWQERTLKRRLVGRKGPPSHRVAVIGQPIDVNCKDWVRHFVDTGEKEHTSPSFQILVRGHYKRVVIGVGRKGRRVQLIAPYWRGPEEAPIKVRPYAI